jgi:hypothetical protein
MPRVKRGDSVWTETHKNGVVRQILYDDDEVLIFFYNSKEVESVDLHQFGSWNYDEHLNQWILREI